MYVAASQQAFKPSGRVLTVAPCLLSAAVLLLAHLMLV